VTIYFIKFNYVPIIEAICLCHVNLHTVMMMMIIIITVIYYMIMDARMHSHTEPKSRICLAANSWWTLKMLLLVTSCGELSENFFAR